MSYKLQPGEKFPEDKLIALQDANKKFSKTAQVETYREDLCKIFDVKLPAVSENAKLWIAGFMEGEASMNVSAKKLQTAKFGLLVDLEFSITQHVNGVSSLLLAQKILNAGRIRYKSGSNATLVLVIDNRVTLEQKVVPFYEKYVVPFSSQEKIQRLKFFQKLLGLFNQAKHTEQSGLVNEILPVWDQLRKQKGQSNEAFVSLADAQSYVENFVAQKKQ